MANYYIKTYGCQMNVHESEKLAGILDKNGYSECSDMHSADVIVLNTCCIRETAETHVLGNLGMIKKLKEKKPTLIVAICGCMAQKEGSADQLKKRCPFINIIFGTHNLHLFEQYLFSAQNGQKVSEIWEKEGEIVENSPVKRSSGANAWVNIMYGCNNFCSYCIVPYVRGRERSRKQEHIIQDVRALIDDGYKEITLLGQNVNSYGNDFQNSDINFSSLLEKLALLDGKFRIKFMTSHPKDLSEEVVKVIASSDKLAKFIHLPVQSGSDRILQLMNRKYTRTDYLNCIDMIRKYIPDAGVSGDIMVGFPTETEADFADTLDLVDRVRYNNLYTFIYSRRSGTPADTMEQVSHAEKQQRIERLIDFQFEKGKQAAGECVGKTFEVLCDSFDNGCISGKSSSDKAIAFEGSEDLVGKFVHVKIVKSKNNKLFGEMI